MPNSGNERKENSSRPARLDLEVFWGKLNNVVLNAIMAIVIYDVRGYPGYLVLKNETKIQFFIYMLSIVKICARKL